MFDIFKSGKARWCNFFPDEVIGRSSTRENRKYPKSSGLKIIEQWLRIIAPNCATPRFKEDDSNMASHINGKYGRVAGLPYIKDRTKET